MNTKIKTVLADFQKSLDDLQEKFKQDLSVVAKNAMKEVEALSQKNEAKGLVDLEKELDEVS